MVCDSIAYHPTFGKIIKFLDSAPKREKSYRLVVYLSRFLSYYLQRKGFSRESVELFKNLKSQVTLIRKALRFLKPLSNLQAAAKVFDNKLMDPVLQEASLIRNLAYAAYLTIDQVAFFKMLTLISTKNLPNAAKWASRFWLLGLAAGVVSSLRTIQITCAKSVTEEEKSVDIKSQMYAAQRKLVWDLLDMFIALNSLNYLNFSEGHIGLAGTITSIMGLKDMWAST